MHKSPGRSRCRLLRHGRYTAADVVNDLWGEIVTANKQPTKILDMMIDGMQQKNLPMAVAPLNSQRYEMILGRQ